MTKQHEDIIWTLWNWIVGLDPGVSWYHGEGGEIDEGYLAYDNGDAVDISHYVNDELRELALEVVSHYDQGTIEDKI